MFIVAIVFSWLKKPIRFFAIVMLIISLLVFCVKYKGIMDFNKFLENNTITSPSGKYQIKASIYKINNYLDLLFYGGNRINIHLLDLDGKELSQLQTGLSHFMLWVIGWLQDQDTVVLFNYDFGTIAWEIVKGNNLQRIDRYDERYEIIYKRGKELYKTNSCIYYK